MSVFDPNLIHPKAPHHLSYGGLDRNDIARRDLGLLKRVLAQLETRYILVWRGRNFFEYDTIGLKSMRCLSFEMVRPFLDKAILIYLGKDRSQTEYICLDISKYPEDKLDPLLTIGQFGDLREADPSISGDDGSILAYAKAMCHWHARSEYCSVCGSIASSGEAGHIRKCSNVDCAVTHFPRTDSAVIVAVTFKDKILLGRQPIWPEGMLSVLAGFVEPGETLEHAVAREVNEEAGLIIKNVCYQHSQPWPFPASLMVGFRAEAVSDKLTINTQEIEMAEWYSREQIAEFDGVVKYLPRKLSISRRLIEEWLYEV
tara:strand:+ start:214 stop:1158 length:945 start_codon:yes stop_codon:yes gene_type:complete